jgi:hypothetical protein
LVLAPASLVVVRFVAPLVLIEIVAVVALVRTGGLGAFASTRRRLLSGGATVVVLALLVIGGHELLLTGEPTASTFPSVALVDAIPSDCVLLNEYSDGGWISLLRWPAVRVSQDGRNVLYGRSLLIRESAVLKGRQGVAGVTGLGATCVLADPADGIVHELASDPGWVLAGRDSQRVLYVQRAATGD